MHSTQDQHGSDTAIPQYTHSGIDPSPCLGCEMVLYAESSLALADLSVRGMSLWKMNRKTLNIPWLGKCGSSSAPKVIVEFTHPGSEQNTTDLLSLQSKQMTIDPMGIRPQLLQRYGLGQEVCLDR